MFIVPMSSHINVERIISFNSNSNNVTAPEAEDKGLGFKEIFQNVIDNVEETEAVAKMDAYKLSIGEMDDMHTMMINSFKAEASLQTMVQLRNKVLEAYSEIMRINL